LAVKPWVTDHAATVSAGARLARISRAGEFEGEVAIVHLEVLAGRLPSRAHGLTIGWAAQHQEELLLGWELASARRPLRRIEPIG